MNMVALVDGQPRLLNLKQFLEFFLQHRREVVMRRTRFELRKARERGHMLEGLAVALSNVDEIIALIKAAPTPAEAKAALMARTLALAARRGDARSARRPTPRGPRACRAEFGWQSDDGYRLSDAQAQAILELRLQRLTGLEQDKITGEYREVMDADRRPARHPRQAGARDADHPRRARRRSATQFGDKRRSRDRRAGRGPVARGPDRAARTWWSRCRTAAT